MQFTMRGMDIRPARSEDRAAIWRILEPTIRAGETYALPRDWTEAEALAYWLAPENPTLGLVDAYVMYRRL